jgi:hypothetical protein
MEIVIGWLFFSIIAGVIASQKGRSGPGFFVLSLFLSPVVGIIAALIARPNIAKVEQSAIESGLNKKCPFCAEIIKQEAKVCRYCGRELASKPQPDAPALTRNEASPTEGKFSRPINVIGAAFVSATVLIMILLHYFPPGRQSSESIEPPPSSTIIELPPGAPAPRSPTVQPTREAVIPTNPTHERLLQRSNADRNRAWTVLLQKSGEQCDRATNNMFRMQDPQGKAYWSVACANGRAFGVTINPDSEGSTSIADCAVLERLTKTGCFESIKDAPPGWRLGR